MHNETIEFQEWSPARILRLNKDEAAALSSHEKIFKVQKVGDGQYRIAPRGGYVGACKLSPNRQILIQPKVPMENFYQLLWLGHRLHSLPNPNTTAKYQSGGVSDWFSFLVLSEIEGLLRGQLRSGYVDVSESLVFLRGSIDFTRPSFGDARLRCNYSDYQIDTPQNRIIRAALELISDGPYQRQIQLKAFGLLSGLGYVKYTRPSLQDIDDIVVDSIHAAYKPAFELIRLLFAGSGVSYAAGETAAPGLFLKMDRIFERALHAALVEELGGALVHYQPEIGKRLQHVAGVPNLGFSMRPDIVSTLTPTAVIARSISSAQFVIDAKYQRPLAKGQYRMGFRNTNVYQIMTYAAALKCPGILAYPRDNQDISVSYRMDEVHFKIETIDLSLPKLEGLRSFARQFTKQLAA